MVVVRFVCFAPFLSDYCVVVARMLRGFCCCISDCCDVCEKFAWRLWNYCVVVVRFFGSLCCFCVAVAGGGGGGGAFCAICVRVVWRWCDLLMGLHGCCVDFVKCVPCLCGVCEGSGSFVQLFW